MLDSYLIDVSFVYCNLRIWLVEFHGVMVVSGVTPNKFYACCSCAWLISFSMSGCCLFFVPFCFSLVVLLYFLLLNSNHLAMGEKIGIGHRIFTKTFCCVLVFFKISGFGLSSSSGRVSLFGYWLDYLVLWCSCLCQNKQNSMQSFFES